MKNLLPLILFIAFAFISCEEKIVCCDPEIEPINDVLDFSELLSFMGGELDQTRGKIPGEYYQEDFSIYREETKLYYHMIPANISTDDTLLVLYIFNVGVLETIWMVAPDLVDPLNAASQMINNAAEQLGEGEYRLVWNNQVNVLSTAKELWDFVEENDINSTNIFQATGTWKIDEYEVFLELAGESGSFGAWIKGP